MLRIGLTGGIGSGKSTVARIFETLGIPVYYADQAARSIMNTNPALKASIIHHFGKASYQNGELDRVYLAGIVFSDKKKLELLNSLTHPATIADADEWMKKQTAPYVIKEAALLFESGADNIVDYVIGVSAPQDLRVSRVTARDVVSAADVTRRIGNQMKEEEKMNRCNFVLRNDEKELLLPQVLALHRKLLEMAEERN